MRIIKSDFYQDLAINRLRCNFCDQKFSRNDCLKRHLLDRCKIKRIEKSDIDQYMATNVRKDSKKFYKLIY